MIHPVRLAFKSKPAPRPVVADLVYHEAGQVDKYAPEYWTLRLYRDNFDSFPTEDRWVIFNWVNDVLSEMRKFDENCTLEVYERVPTR